MLLRDATRRNTLVKDIMGKARSLNLDGIDMDYEYPGQLMEPTLFLPCS
ncbi:glycoside hydrolase family 18 protein [Niabella sp. W65]|nr:glycoside hydrolase family 18 protein [Niabella sp. W65]MCH7369593.1 glycoside hydrolase family 18 protein [Niabella sp. W65]